MPDIIDLIMAEHRRIGRLVDALSDATRSRGGPSAACLVELWGRLTELLDVHGEAEQEIWYPVLWHGGAGERAQAEEAVADLADIHEAACEAALCPVGTVVWSRAASAVLRLTRDHISREERSTLVALARCACPELRDRLARQWAAFVVARVRDARTEGVGLAADGSSLFWDE